MDFILFETIPGKRVLFKPDRPTFSIAAVSTDMCRFTGMSREQIVGRSVFEAFPSSPSDPDGTGHQNLRASLEHVLVYKTPHRMTKQRYDVAGSSGDFRQVYWSNESVPVLNETGELLYIIHTAEEVTEQVVSEQRDEVSKGMEKAYHFFMNAPVIIGYVKGEQYIIEMANDSLLEVWGRTREVVGKPLLQEIPELEEQGFKVLLDQVRTTGEPFYAYEFPITLMRGGREEVLYFDFIYKPFYEDGVLGPASGVISVGLDVTEKVLSRNDSKENEEKYRSLFNSIDQGFCVIEMIFNEDGKPVDYLFLEVNPMFEQQTGLKEAKGRRMRDLVPDHDEHWFDIYGKVSLTGEAIRFEEHSAPLARWFDLYAFRVGDDESRKVAVLFSDITQRKLWEHSIIEKDQNLRNIIQAAPVAMLILRGEKMIIDTINQRMLEMIGKTPDVIGKPLIEVIPELEGQKSYESFSSVFQTGRPAYGNEILVPLMRDGELEERYFNFAYTPVIENGTIVGVMDVAMEVTEQVKARMIIEEKSQELQLAIDVANLGTFRVDLLHQKAQYSDRIMDWFGLTGQGLEISTLLASIHPDDMEACLAAIEEGSDPEGSGGIEIVFRTVHPREATTRHLRSYNKITFNKEGQASVMVGVIQDITQQMLHQQSLKQSEAELQRRVLERTLELEQLNTELKRSNQNLEEFAYAASHDMKEPVRKIHFFSDRLKNELKDQLTPEQHNLFNRLEHSSKRLANLIDDLLMYSHVSRGASLHERVNLDDKIRNVLEDLELEIEQKGAVITVDPLPTITGNKRQMQQFFQNLLSNSLKYSKPGSSPQVQVSSKQVIGKEVKPDIPPAEANRPFHLIEVRDNGIGFSQDDAERIFNVFTRLHGNAEFKGTGVGLSIVRKVVENHGGYIWAESCPGQGARFSVLLPAQ